MTTGLLAYILGSLHVFVESFWARCTALNTLIEGYFGPPGKWAFWMLVCTVLLLLVGKATKVSFNVLKYVLIPSIGLSVVLVMLVPCWSPMKTFPILVSLTTVMMLVKSA